MVRRSRPRFGWCPRSLRFFTHFKLVVSYAEKRTRRRWVIRPICWNRSGRHRLTVGFFITIRTIECGTRIACNLKVWKEGHSLNRGSVVVVTERCKGCGFCVEFCPTHVLKLSSAFNAKGYHPPHLVDGDKCSGCNLCGMYCPDFAIFGYREPQPRPAALPQSQTGKEA